MDSLGTTRYTMPLVLASMLLAALTETVQMLPDFPGRRDYAQASLLSSENSTPVAEIRTFTGTRRGRDVMLEWRAMNERDIAKYEIQRASSVSHGWETVGFASAMYGNISQDYTFLDRDVPAEDVRYLLRIHGKTGEILYSDIITAFLHSAIHSFSVVPEPSGRRNMYLISVGVAKAGPIEMVLNDNRGRTIEKVFSTSELNSGEHTFNLDGSHLAAGSYAVKLQTSDGDFVRHIVLGK